MAGKVGRPKSETKLTSQQVFDLARFGNSDEDIALVCGVSESTLRRDFGTELKQARADMRGRLRIAQMRKAEGVTVLKIERGEEVIYTQPPDTSMLIWLGKQMLSQVDKVEQRVTNDIGIRHFDRIEIE